MSAPRRPPAFQVLSALVLGGLLLALLPTPPVGAGHFTYCYSDINYAFAAQKRVRAAGVSGISAQLDAQSLYPCALGPGQTNGNATWVWVALEGACGGSGNCIMQIGVGKGSSDEKMGWWWAWGRSPRAQGCASTPNRPPYATRFADWNGRQSTFQITFIDASEPGLDYYSLRIDGLVRKKVYASAICWPVTAADWFGETPNRASAIGGTLADPYLLTAGRYRIPNDGTWYGPYWTEGADCQIENPRPPFRCRVVAHDSLHLWTAPR